jgi:alkylation response protein AidB-like acyl-CoA dehydrogenase
LAHAGQRQQFGQPIGAFQAVKHHLATALVDVQFALPLVERAAISLATGDPDAAHHAAIAKAFAAEAVEAAASHAIQVHGAIGYTWECDLHLWMKRTWALSAAWGDSEAQWQQVERGVLDG